MLQWDHVEELINAGYKPYVRRKKQGNYMSLKKGRDEISLGAYDEDSWNRVASLYVIHHSSKNMVEEKQRVEKPKPMISVDKEILTYIISELEAGKSRVQIVAEWGYHPDVVNYAYEKWLELKTPIGKEQNQPIRPSELAQLQARLATLHAQLEAITGQQREDARKILSDLEKVKASVERRGKLLHASCYYARDGKCTQPNIIEALGKQGEPMIDVDEYVCNSCLCYWRFQ